MPKRLERSYTTRLRWTEVEARAALEDLARSGLSEQAFASREGLDLQRLQRWRRRFEAESDTTASEPARPTFVEVPRREAAVLELVLLSGRVLRMRESIDPEVLRRIALALEDDAAC
jgi:hypothetical protein